jgi:hypothetical protein
LKELTKKVSKNWKWIFGILIAGLFLFLRLWKIEEKVNFSMDQGMFLLRAKEIWENKELTLIGPPASPLIDGRHFFQGPAIYYFLIPFFLIAKEGVVEMSVGMVLLNLISLIFLYFAGKNIVGKRASIIGVILLTICPIAVDFSRFVWNPNMLLWLTPIYIWLGSRYILDKRKLTLLGLGVMGGICLQFHFQFSLIILLTLILLFCRKEKLQNLGVYVLGLTIGYLPLIIFDLRNNFYNLKTILAWLTTKNGETMDWQSYYLVAVVPIITLILGYILSKVKSKKLVNYLLLIVVVWGGYYSVDSKGWGQVENWGFNETIKSVKIIENDVVEEQYNIANTVYGDTRGCAWRFLLTMKGIPPQEVTNFNQIDRLYVIGKIKNVWEINTFDGEITQEWPINNFYSVFRLEKKNRKIEKENKTVTIINPVRGRNLWIDKSVKPLTDQYQPINKKNLKATWLLQNEAVNDVELAAEIKKFNNKQELGLWLEVSKSLAIKSGVFYPVNTPWDDPQAVFLSGYAVNDRKKMIDQMVADFVNQFGKKPKSVGAWWIDSQSLDYLESKYGIKSALIVADQKTTDDYGVWGQWWGYPYYPNENNILIPGKDKQKSGVLVTQWALRDPVKAYFGEGPKISNYSLQANDYISQKLDTKYFDWLAKKYLESDNKLTQITVGLETGMEGYRFSNEYEKQIDWIDKNKYKTMTMSGFSKTYEMVYGGENPEIIWIDNWKMTPDYRENLNIKEKTNYNQKMVWEDFYIADKTKFLNRRLETETIVVKGDSIPFWMFLLIVEIVVLIKTGTKKSTIAWWLLTVFTINWWMFFTKQENGFLIFYGKPYENWEWWPFLITGGQMIILWITNRIRKIEWKWMFLGTGLLTFIYFCRYSILEGEKFIGFLVDKFRFIGLNITDFKIENKILESYVAESMLKIDWPIESSFGVLGGLLIWTILISKLPVKLKKWLLFPMILLVVCLWRIIFTSEPISVWK